MQISLIGVTKRFTMCQAESITALESISFSAQTSEFLCLLGPSGCGKSTLLKLLSGLETADEGELLVDDRVITGPRPELGMVFQEYALFPWLSVERNIAFGLEVQGIPKAQRQEEIGRYLDLVGLKEFRKAFPHQLSGGMKQRVALARAMVMRPKVLLMDEPFGALDAFTRMKMQEELGNIWLQAPFTVVFVTHDIDEAVYLADRIILMSPSPGRIKNIIKVNLSRPRNRTSYDFSIIRNQVFEEYGYVARGEEDYVI